MLSRELPASIPVEIWQQCWELTQHAELDALSRTCHFFRDICLPLLFAHITHKDTVYGDHSLYWELSSVTMLRHTININRLATSPKFSAWPRRWQVSNIRWFQPTPAVFDDSYTLVDVSHGLYLESIFRGLSAFTGLRAIEIIGIHIEGDILRTLSKLPALESLACLWTHFSCFSVTPLLRLREFTVSNFVIPTETSFNIFSNEVLERLTFFNLKSLSNQGHYHRLSDLSLSDESLDIPTLFEFLRLCPQLRRLSLNSVACHLTDAVGMNLPPSVIPRLQSFSGYWAKMIIPGHPVEMVSIPYWADTEETTGILQSISQSTLPIRGLSFPFMQIGVMAITLIRERFPYLKFLRFGLDLSRPASYPAKSMTYSSPYSYEEIMTMLCFDEISLPSGIQELEILTGRDEVSPPLCSYLTKLSVLYPSLTIMMLGYCQWVKDINGHWESVERQDSRLSQFLREW